MKTFSKLSPLTSLWVFLMRSFLKIAPVLMFANCFGFAYSASPYLKDENQPECNTVSPALSSPCLGPSSIIKYPLLVAAGYEKELHATYHSLATQHRPAFIDATNRITASLNPNIYASFRMKLIKAISLLDAANFPKVNADLFTFQLPYVLGILITEDIPALMTQLLSIKNVGARTHWIQSTFWREHLEREEQVYRFLSRSNNDDINPINRSPIAPHSYTQPQLLAKRPVGGQSLAYYPQF